MMHPSVMRRVAVYGKGGIGKSTVSSNLTAALSDLGVRVLQIGCDPKHDSTRSLVGGAAGTTILDYLRETPPSERSVDDVVWKGYKGALCVEAGGPEPGVGCAGRGIITTFDFLRENGDGRLDADLVLYDVLGDVVCGGFAVPLRKGYADTVYIVTSGEFMSIYAANNILRGSSNYDPDRIGGLVFNSRGDPDEESRVERFSEAVGVPIVARIGRSRVFMDAERMGKTVVEAFPDSDISDTFRDLAHTVLEGRRHTARPLSESELEGVVLGRRPAARAGCVAARVTEDIVGKIPFSAARADTRAPLGGCAFSGASSTCTSISGLTAVLHAPRSCAHFTVQLDGVSAIGPARHNRVPVPAYLAPDVYCTCMDGSDMVFGGAPALERTLEKAISGGKTDIAVITACPPGIIGDDAVSVCAEAERRHPGVKVTLIREDGNAAGDFMQGVIDSCEALLERYAVRGDTIPFSVNLVGSKTMSGSVMSDIGAITGILEDMGVKVNCVLPGATDLGALRRAARASADLRMNSDMFADAICGFMEERFGVYTIPVPVRGGLSGTRAWVSAVAECLDIKDEGREAMSRISRRFSGMVANDGALLRGRTACVIALAGDSDWVLDALEAAGVDIVGGFVLRREDYSERLDQGRISGGFKVITPDDVPGTAAEIEALHPDVLLSVSKVDVDPTIVQVRIPCAPDTDPFAGKALLDEIARAILAPAEEGWREDVARIRYARKLPGCGGGFRGCEGRVHRDTRAYGLQVLSRVRVGIVVRQGQERPPQPEPAGVREPVLLRAAPRPVHVSGHGHLRGRCARETGRHDVPDIETEAGDGGRSELPWGIPCRGGPVRRDCGCPGGGDGSRGVLGYGGRRLPGRRPERIGRSRCV